MTTATTICGKKIQHDASGQGHNWKTVATVDLSPDVVTIIEGEIIDGGRESGEIVVGGQHYRWM